MLSVLPRYELSWVKLRAWELTDFDVVLLLDADVTIIGDISPLFTLPTHFAAVPDQRFHDPAMRYVIGDAAVCTNTSHPTSLSESGFLKNKIGCTTLAPTAGMDRSAICKAV